MENIPEDIERNLAAGIKSDAEIRKVGLFRQSREHDGHRQSVW